MTTRLLAAFAAAALLAAAGCSAAEPRVEDGAPPPAPPSDRLCVQVISCGEKDGALKEYPTPCDAEDDGATDIRPKQGDACR